MQMGISLLCPFADIEDLDSRLESLVAKSLTFKEKNVRTVLRSISSKDCDSPKLAKMKSVSSKRMILRGSLSFNGRVLNQKRLGRVFSLKSPSSSKEEWMPAKTLESKMPDTHRTESPVPGLNMHGLESPSREPITNQHLAAVKLQKTYKSFRTRRRLADCAVLVEQRWWKLLDFAELKRSSVSFFEIEKQETALSRWSRARTRAAKVGKGLSKDDKARKLALQHWLEAIDPRHRYGHNLQFYYAKWLHCQSRQPFFYWLDIGEGKEVNLERCPRPKLHQQCIKYLGPIEREDYEVTMEDGRFMYKLCKKLIDTRIGPPDAKWIFVLSTSKILYVGMKMKGKFQHSSFLAGGATLSAGRLVIVDGILQAVWPHSGHYLPTEENFDAFISYLEEHNVDLQCVKRSPDDEEEVPKEKPAGTGIRNSVSEPDFNCATEETDAKSYYRKETKPRKDKYGSRPPLARGLKSKITELEIPKKEDIILAFQKKASESDPEPETANDPDSSSEGYETAEEFLSDIELMVSKRNLFDFGEEEAFYEPIPQEKIMQRINSHKGMKSYQLAQQLSCKWSTGAGPRIGCVRDYPSELQLRALEEVCLSPRSSFMSPRRSGFSNSIGRETSGPAKKSPLSSENVVLPKVATP